MWHSAPNILGRAFPRFKSLSPLAAWEYIIDDQLSKTTRRHLDGILDLTMSYTCYRPRSFVPTIQAKTRDISTTGYSEGALEFLPRYICLKEPSYVRRENLNLGKAVPNERVLNK